MVSGSRANRKKGWYRDKLEMRTKGSSRVDEKERQQLYTELLLHDPYFGDKAKAATSRIHKQQRYKKSKKVKMTKRKRAVSYNNQ